MQACFLSDLILVTCFNVCHISQSWFASENGRMTDRQTDTPPNHLDHLWKFHLCKHTHSYKERERWEIMKYKLFCITFYLLQIFIWKTLKSKYIDYNWVKLLKKQNILLLVWLLFVWSWMKTHPISMFILFIVSLFSSWHI